MGNLLDLDQKNSSPHNHGSVGKWGPGRCVACLQMGYFPLNHDYGRNSIGKKKRVT